MLDLKYVLPQSHNMISDLRWTKRPVPLLRDISTNYIGNVGICSVFLALDLRWMLLFW